MAKYYASKHGYGVSPNRELVAMGMANIVGSFFQYVSRNAPCQNSSPSPRTTITRAHTTHRRTHAERSPRSEA